MTDDKQLTPGDLEKLRPFVTDGTRPVYALRNLPEEVVAVLFAYYSRSRESLRENLLKLIQEEDLGFDSRSESDPEAGLLEAREKARAFHEKWVVGYGHSSVAEHAVVHVAIEDVSILGSKVIEDARLASFTEKSTRYVPFDTRRFHTPEELAGAGDRARAFRAGIDALMSAYGALMEPMVGFFLENHPVREGQTERGRQSACRAQACDVLRYLLPAATHTNIGMTINARALEGLLSKMMSSPLTEVQHYGTMIKEEALKIVPTLIKYAERSEYRVNTEMDVRGLADGLFQNSAAARPDKGTTRSPRVRLVRFDADAEDRILEAILYAVTNRSLEEVQRVVADLPADARKRLFDGYHSRRGRHDAPLRALEETRYTFEIVTDYGAYRDLQRHRMAAQYPQRLTVDLGFECPPEIEAAGRRPDFVKAMDAAADCYRLLESDFPEEAQYVVPLAFRKRYMLSMNLRELHHFVQLRSARQGHASYRGVAQEVYQEVLRVHPTLGAFLRVDLADYALSRS